MESSPHPDSLGVATYDLTGPRQPRLNNGSYRFGESGPQACAHDCLDIGAPDWLLGAAMVYHLVDDATTQWRWWRLG
jgi:hypothetical protein